MTSKIKPYIVIVDDDVKADLPLLDYIHNEFGEENVYQFEDPSEGIQFIKRNLSRRIIVLLDIMFHGKPVGFDVFQEIIEKSSLVCFIIRTGNFEMTSHDQLLGLINGHAWYVVPRDRSAKEILRVINEAASHLELRIDGALEEWIARHSNEKMHQVFIKTRSGQSYTLNDILVSLRTGKNGKIGKDFAESVLQLAISMLVRDKSTRGE